MPQFALLLLLLLLKKRHGTYAVSPLQAKMKEWNLMMICSGVLYCAEMQVNISTWHQINVKCTSYIHNNTALYCSIYQNNYTGLIQTHAFWPKLVSSSQTQMNRCSFISSKISRVQFIQSFKNANLYLWYSIRRVLGNAMYVWLMPFLLSTKHIQPMTHIPTACNLNLKC